MIRALKGKSPPFLLLPLIGLALVLFLFNLPWQIKKVAEAERSGNTRNK